MSHNDDGFAVPNVEYNLITTLSNLLQAEEALHKYISDAEGAGASDVASLFRELHDSNRRIAKQMREVLHDQFMS
jgi:rubrerythrin